MGKQGMRWRDFEEQRRKRQSVVEAMATESTLFYTGDMIGGKVHQPWDIHVN